ncbi:hypothetical protein, partial [Anoxybacillus sp. LAT_11]|uniref:hypothetical protein n=1 Tax=Anoxybacillus sp. LAT_11 TaxID=2862718 RepID=UPI001EEC5D3B
LGDSKPDWWIIQEIAKRLGADWNYSGPKEIMDEIASLAPLFSQAQYENLEGWNSLCWGSYDGAHTPILYKERFN